MAEATTPEALVLDLLSAIIDEVPQHPVIIGLRAVRLRAMLANKPPPLTRADLIELLRRNGGASLLQAEDGADAILVAAGGGSLEVEPTVSEADLERLWRGRKNLHGGELMPQLIDYARAVLAASRLQEPA